jgi:hypothetical protein
LAENGAALDLTRKDRHVATSVDRIHGHVVSAALVYHDFVWIAVAPIALSKKRFAAAMSRFAVSRKSTALSYLSTGR